jgi:hypothetical protein
MIIKALLFESVFRQMADGKGQKRKNVNRSIWAPGSGLEPGVVHFYSV